VELTAAGEAFLPRARRILEEAEAARTEARQAASGATGTLRVGVGATAGLELVPNVLRAFGSERPGVELELHQMDWEDYFGGLPDGALDAAFLWLPVEHERLDYAVLHEEPRVAALPAGHRLAVADELPLQELLAEPWVWVETHPAALRFWTCEDVRGGPARRGPQVRSMEGVLEVVRAGGCVATVPASQARVSGSPGIVFRPVEGLPPAALAIAWHTAGELPAVRALVETARRVSSEASE
jgi:DNA-binding transcriptional LysR family regulator